MPPKLNPVFPYFQHNRTPPTQQSPDDYTRLILHLSKLKEEEPVLPNIRLNEDERADFFEVEHLESEEVLNRIEDLLEPVTRVVGGVIEEGVSLTSNLWPTTAFFFLNRLERFVMGKGSLRTITTFTDDSSAEKARRIVTVLSEMIWLIETSNVKSKTTILDQYSIGPFPVFDKINGSGQIDATITDICCLLGCTRDSIPIFAVSIGLVSGFVKISNDGCELDGTCSGIEGCNIRSDSKLVDKETLALFILVVEKHAMFTWLNSKKFWERYPCIMITGKGFPDSSTILLLKKMQRLYKLPVFGFFNPNPRGFQIFITYRYGSKRTAFDSFHLAVRRMRLIGMTSGDITTYFGNNFRSVITTLSTRDEALLESQIEFANDLDFDLVELMPAWKDAMFHMLNLRSKSQMEAFHFLNDDIINNDYLPFKLIGSNPIKIGQSSS